MTKANSCELVYRATRDGFSSDAFHSRCDDKPNLVSIIRNNLNYVFGGYTSAAWNRNSLWITDRNAFIFSLRRNGVTKKDKFMNNCNGQGAFFGSFVYHLRYGNDIGIKDSSNTKVGSWCNFGRNYQLPAGITYATETANFFLAGNFNRWVTAEIEVYEIKFV
jgi:hypothetical protein